MQQSQVLAVLPEKSDEAKIIGKASFPGQSVGKLMRGNRAIVRLDAYPARQYGSIEGLISNISALPQQEMYLIDVDFPNGMTTSYGKSISFRQEMAGQLRVFTEERRVIERVFDRLNDLLKNS